MAVVEEKAAVGITEVEVITRWRGSPVNPLERCGIPDDLATELAAMNPPVVRIIRRNVPPTAGIGLGGKIGGDAPVNQTELLLSLVKELVEELKASRKR